MTSISRGTVEEFVSESLAEQLGVESSMFHLMHQIDHLGGDTLGLVRLVELRLKQKYGVKRLSLDLGQVGDNGTACTDIIDLFCDALGIASPTE